MKQYLKKSKFLYCVRTNKEHIEKSHLHINDSCANIT